MRLPSLFVLAALAGAAAFGLYVTEPQSPTGALAPNGEAVPAPEMPREAGARSPGETVDARADTGPGSADPGPRAAPGTATGAETVDAQASPQPQEGPASPAAAPAETAALPVENDRPAPERPAQTCGLVAREAAIGAVVFRAGPESLVVTAADLIQSAPLAMGGAEWGVSIELCPDSAREMAAFTERRIGQQLQIISSGALISAPILRTAIRDGRLTLTGGFDRAQAEKIADRIAGKPG